MRRRLNSSAGFTLVEMLVVLALFAILAALTTVNLGQTQTTTNLATTVDTMLADIKRQQLLAMAGDTGSTTTQQSQGILVQSNQYTLFAGSTFNAGDNNNFVISAPQNTTFSTTLPGSTVLFTKGPGDVSGFVNGSNTITITSKGSSKTITLTRFGALTVN